MGQDGPSPTSPDPDSGAEEPTRTPDNQSLKAEEEHDQKTSEASSSRKRFRWGKHQLAGIFGGWKKETSGDRK